MKHIALLGLTLFALLGVGESLRAQPRPASEAETAFWARVKDSRNVAEIRAYLEAFPSGAYAELARARLQALGPSVPQASAPLPAYPSLPGDGSPAPLPAPPAGGSVLTDPDLIREVQERLYNLNYPIVVTGRPSQETYDAIRAWQQVVKRPITGDMDAEQLQHLRSARMPSVWGALAFVARGGSAVVWSRPSRREAERDALSECAKRGGGGCQVVTAAETSCGALGFYTGVVGSRRHWGAFPALGPTIGQAVDTALTVCRQQAKRPEACGVRLMFCADGSHKQ